LRAEEQVDMLGEGRLQENTLAEGSGQLEEERDGVADSSQG
jgi:hypothetical protein